MSISVPEWDLGGINKNAGSKKNIVKNPERSRGFTLAAVAPSKCDYSREGKQHYRTAQERFGGQARSPWQLTII